MSAVWLGVPDHPVDPDDLGGMTDEQLLEHAELVAGRIDSAYADRLAAEWEARWSR